MTINYRIQEVKVKDYIQCLEPLYAVLEKKNKSKSEVDPFMKTILASHGGMTIEQWDAGEKQRLYEKALSMGMGTFHENLMGKFKDYETLPQGHSTGVDVISEKHNELWEVKNRDNTMNSGSGETVVRKLMKVVEEGRKAILVTKLRPIAYAKLTGTALPICLYCAPIPPTNVYESGNV